MDSDLICVVFGIERVRAQRRAFWGNIHHARLCELADLFEMLRGETNELVSPACVNAL